MGDQTQRERRRRRTNRASPACEQLATWFGNGLKFVVHHVFAHDFPESASHKIVEVPVNSEIDAAETVLSHRFTERGKLAFDSRQFLGRQR